MTQGLATISDKLLAILAKSTNSMIIKNGQFFIQFERFSCIYTSVLILICRLDFEKFSLRGPHKVYGVCRKDRFMVTTPSPHGIGVSDLCGENTGQHRKFHPNGYLM